MNIKSKQLFFLKKDYSTQFADWLTNRKEVIVSNVCPISTSSFYCSPALLHWDTIKTTNTLIFGGKEWYFNLEEENIKKRTLAQFMESKLSLDSGVHAMDSGF